MAVPIPTLPPLLKILVLLTTREEPFRYGVTPAMLPEVNNPVGPVAPVAPVAHVGPLSANPLM